MNKEKLEIIHSWVSANVEEPCEISPASNDASFRSYWRLSFDNDTKILMHAPPKLEPLENFLDINKYLYPIYTIISTHANRKVPMSYAHTFIG